MEKKHLTLTILLSMGTKVLLGKPDNEDDLVFVAVVSTQLQTCVFQRKMTGVYDN